MQMLGFSIHWPHTSCYLSRQKKNRKRNNNITFQRNQKHSVLLEYDFNFYFERCKKDVSMYYK